MQHGAKECPDVARNFLRRIIPLVLLDAQFSSSEERVEYSKHWETRYLKLKTELDYLSV